MGPREDAFGSLRKVGRRRHRRHRRGEGVLRRFGIVSVRTSLRALFPPSLAFAVAVAVAVAVQDLQGFADALFGARGERSPASRGARVFRGESARFFVGAPRARGPRAPPSGAALTPLARHATAASRAAVTADWRRVADRDMCAKGFELRRAEGRRGERAGRGRGRGGADAGHPRRGEDGEATRSSASADGGGRAEGEVVEGGGGGAVAAGGGDQGPPRGEVRRERVRRGRGRGSRRSRRPPSVVLGAPAPAPPVARGGGSSALRSREDPPLASGRRRRLFARLGTYTSSGMRSHSRRAGTSGSARERDPRAATEVGRARRGVVREEDGF